MKWVGPVIETIDYALVVTIGRNMGVLMIYEGVIV